jgi:hypothetical protein
LERVLRKYTAAFSLAFGDASGSFVIKRENGYMLFLAWCFISRRGTPNAVFGDNKTNLNYLIEKLKKQ